MARLSQKLEEMTKHISSQDDNNLIEYLKDGVNLSKDLHQHPSGSITALINNLTEEEIYHKYAKTFKVILKYSLLVVQRFCQGNAQVILLPFCGIIYF